MAPTSTVDEAGTLVYGRRLSSVVPATSTGEGRFHQLTGLDLAMKLHYVRGVYLFDKEAVDCFDIFDLKKPMFEWLVHFFMAAGRIRISGDDNDGGGVKGAPTGRPFVKLNDGGVRVVEAKCSKSVEEWLAMEKCCSLSDELLVCDHVLGPDLFFTPLVFVQFTWFNCGGLSVGLSWTHVLGDPLSATSFMSALGHFMRSDPPPKPLTHPDPPKPQNPTRSPTHEHPLPLKRVEPVGSHWVAPPPSTQMISRAFHFSQKDLNRLRSSIPPEDRTKFNTIRSFDLISAVIWKSVARIRRGTSDPRLVTVFRFRSTGRGSEIPCNDGEIGSIEEDSPAEADLGDLAAAVAEKAVDQNGAIGEIVDREIGESDFVVYGARLSFVDLEGADLYGFEMKGRKPVFVNYTMGGVGEEGVVLVMPTAEEGGERVATVTLPESEVEALRREFEQTWYIG